MADTKGDSAARIAPFAIYMLVLALGPWFSGWMPAVGVDGRWMYAVRAGLAAVLLLWLWRRYSELNWPVGLSWRAWLTSVAAGCVIFMLWILPYPGWARMGETGQGFDPTGTDGQIDIFLAAFRIGGAVLVVPLMEELFWRSFLMRWLDNKHFLEVDASMVSRRAFVATAVIFATGHHLWLAGLVAGLAYGALFVVYRNLWTSVIAHATTNAMLGVWVMQTGSWRYW